MGLDVGALLVIAVIVYGCKAIADGFVDVVELIRRHRRAASRARAGPLRPSPRDLAA